MTNINDLAEIIWDYHHLNQRLQKADCLLVMGSHDPRVAAYAVDLFEERCAPLLIFSGGTGRHTAENFHKPEAEIFAEVARKRGVPESQIILENKSTNTGENIIFSRKIIEEKKLPIRSIILVHKPYMERRAFATFQKIWPEMKAIVTSPPLSFEEYCNRDFPRDHIINIMLGDLQRIKIYADRGYQIPQKIPPKVWQAYKHLVKLGYDKELLKN